ncbi:MAG: hypothetical protein ACWGNV_00725 [Bacteroidales bacterium]
MNHNSVSRLRRPESVPLRHAPPSREKGRGSRLSFRAGIPCLLVLSLFLLTRCEKSDGELSCYDPPEGQPVYFQYRYINHAWGYQDHGWLIDGYGNVRYFEYPEDFRSPDSTGFLSMEDLEHNLTETDSLITTIRLEELEAHVALIQGAASGEINERQHLAYDAGTSTLACYLYDSGQKAYRYVFLGMSGDWEQLNLSEEAGDLIEWLRQYHVFWLSD